MNSCPSYPVAKVLLRLIFEEKLMIQNGGRKNDFLQKNLLNIQKLKMKIPLIDALLNII